MMRILIIGGTRFIGPWVVRRLSDTGHEITLFHRNPTQTGLPAGIKHILGDRQRLPDFAGEFERLAPQVVLDMIPFTEGHARVVMSVFKGIARRVLAISSQDVYRAYGGLIGVEPGPVEPVPLAEDAPLRQKLYPYRGETPRDQQDPRRWMDDYDKIPVERVVMGEPDLPGAILRLPMVYGPGDPQRRLFNYLKRMDDARPAILLEQGLASWRWTKGYVENVAVAIALAVVDERSTGQVYNVGETETLSETEWVWEIGRAAGWNGQVVALPQERLPAHLATDMNTAQHLVVDTSRIRGELGYVEPVSRDKALTRTVAWERAHPPDKVDAGQFDYASEDAVLARLTLVSNDSTEKRPFLPGQRPE
jgi:nucleoside-diphosphate-sugar epimerase